MVDFCSAELKIEVSQIESAVTLRWVGSSRARNPSELLDPYLASVVCELEGKKAIVDFSALDYMNSSSVSPIIEFIKSLEEAKVESVIRYNKALAWQAASFVPLSSMVRSFRYVTVDGVS